MENKSTLPFIIMMTIAFIGLVVVQSIFFKPKIPEAGVVQNADDGGAKEFTGDEGDDGKQTTENGASNEAGEGPAGEPEQRPEYPRQFLTLGTFQSDAGPLVATFDSRGATIRRIELNARKTNGKLLYRDVDYEKAFVGQLELVPSDGGCEVRSVIPGTPAAEAGIQTGDEIKSIDGEPVINPVDFDAMLADIKSGREITIAVRRDGKDLQLPVTTARMPMQIIRPTSPDLLTDRELRRRAFQLTLKQQIMGTWPDLDQTMRTSNWKSESLTDGGKPVVEFTFDLPRQNDGRKLQVVKRYRLSSEPDRLYHIELEFEIRNLGDQATTVNYELCGPTGLPQEGWWYQQKIHGGTWAFFKTAGARDITMGTAAQPFKFVSGPQIVADRTQDPPLAGTPLVEKGADDDRRAITHLGVDTLYFNVALIPRRTGFRCYSAFGLNASTIDEKKGRRRRLTDISYVLYSDPIELQPWDESRPDSAFTESFEIFAGPKDPQLLETYGLQDTRTFGWFAMFSKPLIWLLHLLHKMTFGLSWGLAIILLTVIVRLCMVPISRKAALNAQMMQYLAPQMKELQEKHKEDPKKFFQARSELCARYNYRPLGGCLLMFVQLPIFLGLYRGLSVDVALRDAPLINGLSWCTNLGGPDQLFSWQSWMPSFLGGETGFLGPYFNLLPIIAIVLMFVQQKLFMPPATDDQSATAQKMMKFMMFFIGFIFFKVAAGLCVYFITSSIWGIVERKMLPKPELDTSKFESGEDSSGDGKKAKDVSLPLRNEKEIEARKKRDRERKRKMRDRQ